MESSNNHFGNCSFCGKIITDVEFDYFSNLVSDLSQCFERLLINKFTVHQSGRLLLDRICFNCYDPDGTLSNLNEVIEEIELPF